MFETLNQTINQKFAAVDNLAARFDQLFTMVQALTAGMQSQLQPHQNQQLPTPPQVAAPQAPLNDQGSQQASAQTQPSANAQQTNASLF